jgi:hypothetical protein
MMIHNGGYTGRETSTKLVWWSWMESRTVAPAQGFRCGLSGRVPRDPARMA